MIGFVSPTDNIMAPSPSKYDEKRISSIGFTKCGVVHGIIAGCTSTLVGLEDVVSYVSGHVDRAAMLICNMRNSTELSHKAGDSVELFACIFKGEDYLQTFIEFLENAKDRTGGGTTIGRVIKDPKPSQEYYGRRKLMLDVDVTKILKDYYGDGSSYFDYNQEGDILNATLKDPIDILKDGAMNILTGNLNGNITLSIQRLAESVLPMECLNDSTSKLPEDEAYVAKNLSDSWIQFYEVITDLPNINGLPDDSPELATYVAIISSVSLFAFLCIIVIIRAMYTELFRKKEEIKQDATAFLLPPPLWPKVLLFFFSLATAIVVGVGLNLIHKQASEGTSQIRDLADYFVTSALEIKDMFTAARTAVVNVITVNIDGFIGCLSPSMVANIMDDASGLVNSSIDDMEDQIPYDEVLQLADDIDNVADTVESTVNVRIAIVLAFTIVSIVAVFCAGLEYLLARSKLNRFKRLFSCCKVSGGCVAFSRKTLVAFICALVIVGSCIAFGASAGLLHLIATNCIDPQQQLLDLIPSDSGNVYTPCVTAFPQT